MLLGVIVATKVLVFPLFNVKFVVFNFTAVIGISVLYCTVTLQLAVFPFTALAIIVALPFAFAVTTPISFTVATLVLEDDHVILSLLICSVGLIVAVNFAVPPLTVKLIDVLDKVTFCIALAVFIVIGYWKDPYCVSVLP